VTRYEHTQTGHVIIWSLLAVILIVNGGLLGHHPRDGKKIAFGTNDPDGLTAGIRGAIRAN
jgi:hypothetical protein